MKVWGLRRTEGYFIFAKKDGGNLFKDFSRESIVTEGSMSFDDLCETVHINSGRFKWEKVEIPDEFKDKLLSEKSLILKGYL